MNEFEAIIFDLGKVVIHLDELKTHQAFLTHGELSDHELTEAYSRYSFFKEFERGEISDSQFRDHIRRLIKNDQLTNDQIDEAWNAMLKHIDLELIDQVKSLKESLQLFVLSNTNIIHERGFIGQLRDTSAHQSLEEVFHKVYLSHHIGARKPELRSWQMILEENKLEDPQKVLFLDDREENIMAAKTLGIRCIQIQDPHHTRKVLANLS